MPQKNNVTSFINSHFYEQHYADKFSADGFQRLRTYLGNVKKGQPKIYCAPFAKGDSMDKVLNDWKATLVSIKDEWPTLWEFEEDLAKKVGPMSVQLPLSERMGDIAHYYDDILLSSKPVASPAIESVMREFAGLRGLRLRSQTRTVDLMKKSTNSGNPFFTTRRNVVQDTIPCDSAATNLESEVSMALGQMRKRDYGATAVVGWRGQEGGPEPKDVKQRVIWMFPFSVNINELQVYQPLIEGAQALHLVPAWVSMDEVDREVTELFDTKGSDDLVVCTDFSRFDQHFNASLQNVAKTVLRSFIGQEADGRTWLREVFPIKYEIPLCWEAEGTYCTYFEGAHGMASGSGGTNVDETLAHRTLQYEAAYLAGTQLNPHSQCLGDDGILSYPGITVDEVVAAYQSHGQECNPDKQYASTQDCVYLRRWHHTNYREAGICVGVYSTTRALGRLRYLERFMDPEYWSPKLVALRQLSIIENTSHHPLFHEFVDFCMKRDKYRLGLDIPGFLANLAVEAKESIDHMPDFLGYTKTLQGFRPEGINNWAVVKYLKSKQ